MFSTTNLTAQSAAASPSAAAVCPSFSLMNNSTSHSHVTSSSTNPAWRLTAPSVVSIINGTPTSVSMPTHSNILYIASQPCSTTNGNLLLQSPQTVRLVPPSSNILNHSQTSINTPVAQLLPAPLNQDIKPGICIDTPVLGRIDPAALVRALETPIKEEKVCVPDTNDEPAVGKGDDSEIELFVNNVVCSFALGCQLNLRKIAMEAANVIYRRDHAMVLMKIRNPYCSANVWSSGKVTVTGTTSEDDAQRAARRIARVLQRLGFKTKFRNFRVVNCLATCAMPWPIDIVKLSRTYPEYVSYEPEIHPGATVRLPDKAVLKVFTTGRITLTAPSVDRINTAVNEFYPQLFECRNLRHGFSM